MGTQWMGVKITAKLCPTLFYTLIDIAPFEWQWTQQPHSLTVVWIDAVRISLSLLTCTATARSSFHFKKPLKPTKGRFPSWIWTTVSFPTLCPLLAAYLTISCSWLRYSVFYLLQETWEYLFILRHLDT